MDMLFVLAAFIGAWVFTAKKLSKRHFVIRHAAGLIASLIAMVFAITISVDLGLTEKHGDAAETGGPATVFLAAFLAVLSLLIYGAVKLLRQVARHVKGEAKATVKPPPTTPAARQQQPGSGPKQTESSQGKPSLASKKPRQKQAVPPPVAVRPPSRPTPLPQDSRAIRTGWSMGEIAFTYEDTNGNITSRTVTVHSVSTTYIKGECQDRQAARTFRVDRIIGDLVDLETGEILNPKKWARMNA